MKIGIPSHMKASVSLPSNYSRYTILEPSKELKFITGAIVTGIALLLIVSWLLVTFVNELRPTALEGMRLHDMFNSTATGISFVMHPALFRDLGFALIAVLILHELVHALFYWLFSSKRPRLGFQGLFPYAAAPSGVYFPRNQFIIIGLSPIVLITTVGLLLMVIVPIAFVPFLLFFVAFNAAGATGDLIMAIQLMRISSDTVMEDKGSGVIIYRFDEFHL
jgi:hypothetical protein